MHRRWARVAGMHGNCPLLYAVGPNPRSKPSFFKAAKCPQVRPCSAPYHSQWPMFRLNRGPVLPLGWGTGGSYNAAPANWFRHCQNRTAIIGAKFIQCLPRPARRLRFTPLAPAQPPRRDRQKAAWLQKLASWPSQKPGHFDWPGQFRNFPCWAQGSPMPKCLCMP
jgi:hypothetical protein